MPVTSQEEPFIKIEEEDGGNRHDVRTYTDFRTQPTLEDVKPKLVVIFFWTMVILSLLFVIVFLYLVAFQKSVPNYFIGFIGAIIGLFFAKRPDEI